MKFYIKVYNEIFFILLLIFLSVVYSCSDGSNNKKLNVDSIKTVQSDSVKSEILKDSVYQYKLDRQIKYSILKVKGKKTLRVLDSLYGVEGRKIILALNRLDSGNLRRGDSIIVPDTIVHLMSYSPFSFVIEAARSIPKLLLISKRVQAIAAYENGVLRRWGPTSTGRKSKQTPAGLFAMNWKSKETISTIDSTWILPYYFNFENKEGVALHQFTMPGYPASHACVRLLEQDAIWIYYWAEQWIVSRDGEDVVAYGTPIIVFDDYAWGKPPAWKYLPQNPDTLLVPQEHLEETVKKYFPIIWERREQRDSIIAARKQELAEKQSQAELKEKKN